MKKLLAMVALALPLIAGVALAADFDGDSRDDIAIFRASTGLWAIRGVTRVYFGGSADTPAAGDYDGDGVAEIGIFRKNSGLWAIQGVTRAYFGGSADTPVTGGGGGQRTYDYVVKAGDGADLVRALESNTYRSVFVPAGDYNVDEQITVDNVRRIVGAGMGETSINFVGDGDYLYITAWFCKIEGINFNGGGSTSESRGNVYVIGDYVTIESCKTVNAIKDGFSFPSNADYISFIDCIALSAIEDGFQGYSANLSSHFVNCAAGNCGSAGFIECNNLSSCYVYNAGVSGFRNCDRISSSIVDGNNNTDYGFRSCDYISSCTATGCTVNSVSCNNVDSDSCNF